MPTFTVCPKSKVKQTVKKFDATHLVSMLDPGDHIYRPHRINPENWIIQFFEDEEKDDAFNAPTIDNAKTFLDFGSRLPNDAVVVVNCFAGVCRSSEVAMALWLQSNGTSKLNEVGEWIISVVPRACPNLLLAKHFDDIFELDGKFLTLCENIGKDSVKRTFQL